MTPTQQVILYAEDDESDAFLLQHAFVRTGIDHNLVVVPNGKEAIDYLSGEGADADRARHPLPILVLLDLNMPRTSGLEVLKWIRSTPSVATLPVLVLTSSNQDADIHRAYLQGTNGYLVKPDNLEGIVIMHETSEGIIRVGRQDASLKTHVSAGGQVLRTTTHPAFSHRQIENWYGHPHREVDVAIIQLAGNVEHCGPATKLQPNLQLMLQADLLSEGELLLNEVIVVVFHPIPFSTGPQLVAQGSNG